MPFIIIGLVILALGFYLMSTYNFFHTAKVRITAATQEIANQLKRQANLIPNLSESAKGYLKHEKGIFDTLAAARQTILSGLSNPSELSKASTTMDKVMPQLMAVVESNPQIKGDGVVSKLMDELRDTSDKIMYSRRTVIDLVADYNTKRVTFPSNLIASAFGFTEMQGLQVENIAEVTAVSADETKEVKVSL